MLVDRSRDDKLCHIAELSKAIKPSGLTMSPGFQISSEMIASPPADLIVAMESQVPHRSWGRYGLGQILLGGGGGCDNTDPDDEDDYEDDDG